MGWLRDLIAASNGSVNSLGQLAAEALGQPEWPAEVRIQQRSLAALLSKIDRGQEVGWLLERPGVQRALARVLDLRAEDVAREARAHEDESERVAARLIRLRDLPAARPLDLAVEALPSGVPEALLLPPPHACWWLAPSGSGRTLLGRWLEARGRARFFEGRLPGSDEVPEGGRVYIELPEAPRDGEVPRPEPGWVVAAPFAPPPDSGFELVRSPPLASVLGPVLRWARERLPADTPVRADTVEPWLAERIERGEVRTLGELLGVVGALDELGSRASETRSLERLARRHVEQRLARTLDPGAPHASWVRKQGFDALVGIAERGLVDFDADLSQPRSFEEWLELMPPELERGVDVDWVRLSLKRADASVRAVEVERAARRLPPGAYRLVTALEHAGLLLRHRDERLALEPAWVRRVALDLAVKRLIQRSPLEWGEALLWPRSATLVARALLDRAVRVGPGLLEPVLDLEIDDEPATAAVLDAALRITGIARLLGAEPSQELLEGIWSEAERLALCFEDELPLSRVQAAPRGPSGADTDALGATLLEAGTFHLAALSVSEVLVPRKRTRLAALVPWHDSQPHAALAAVYDAIHAALASAPPWREGAIRLVARVRAVIGNARGPDRPHVLEWPAEIVDEVHHEVLSIETLERAPLSGELVRDVLALARARGLSPRAVAHAFWQSWEEAGRPTTRLLEPTSALAPLLFQHLPGAVLERWLGQTEAVTLPYELLGEEAWHVAVRFPAVVGDANALAVLPVELLETVVQRLRAFSGLGAGAAVLWRRAADACLDALDRELDAAHTDEGVLVTLLDTVPPEHVPSVVAALRTGDRARRLGSRALDGVRRFLHRASAARRDGWRLAYELLALIERDLAAVRQGV